VPASGKRAYCAAPRPWAQGPRAKEHDERPGRVAGQQKKCCTASETMARAGERAGREQREEEARRQRAHSERMHLVERSASEYTICGESGRCYEVVGDEESWTCTCPDHNFRRKVCKHILFVRERVLGRRPAARVQLASDYGDEKCSICLEVVPAALGTAVQCLQCGHATHAECLRTWCVAARRPARCPLCRGDDMAPRCAVPARSTAAARGGG